MKLLDLPLYNQQPLAKVYNLIIQRSETKKSIAYSKQKTFTHSAENEPIKPITGPSVVERTVSNQKVLHQK